jgi:hypothetical protein
VEEGQWVDGKLIGYCKRTYKDGRTLEGEFRAGKVYNGSGVVMYPNGAVEEGQWVEGKLTGNYKQTYRSNGVVPPEHRDRMSLSRPIQPTTGTLPAQCEFL